MATTNFSEDTSAKRNKNKRSKANRDKKKEFFKGMKITQRESHVRTLTKSGRKALRKALAPRQYIWPWVKDPYYKLDASGKAYDRASLLGLPTELRQYVLACTLDDVASKSKGEIGKWIGALSSVAPLARVDMLHVGSKWKQAKEQASGKNKLPLPNPLRGPPCELPVRIYDKPTAKVNVPQDANSDEPPVQKGGKKNKKVRPQKCYKCGQRHYGKDPVCTMARKDPEFWEANTRKIPNKQPITTRDISTAFTGKHIIFED